MEGSSVAGCHYGVAPYQPVLWATQAPFVAPLSAGILPLLLSPILSQRHLHGLFTYHFDHMCEVNTP